MAVLVTMPKWGLTMQSGSVTGWIANEGEAVSEGAPLLTVETEKAVNDVESPADGILYRIVTPTGDEAAVGAPLAVIVAAGETPDDAELATLLATAGPKTSGASSDPGSPPAGSPRAQRPAIRDSAGRISASPAARKRAGELGVDLAAVTATGPGGRITSEDVERAAAELAALPRETTITSGNGATIHALVAGPSDATSRYVLIHGLGGSLVTWSALLENLAADSRVAAIDLPGHGESDKPDPASYDYSPAALAREIGEAIIALNMAPAIVVGHSLGALIAMELAALRPKLVQGAALINSAGFGSEVNQQLLDLVAAEPSRESARAMLELFFEDRKMVLDRGVNDMFEKQRAPGASAAMRAMSASTFGPEGQLVQPLDRLKTSPVPFYVIWGQLDRVFPPMHAVNAATTLPGAWLDVISGVGHVPQVEAAARVSELIRRWRGHIVDTGQLAEASAGAGLPD